MVETRSQRPTGMKCLRSTPWGTHFCQFYRTHDELFDLVAGFLQAGLKEKEFCAWIVPRGITLKTALEGLEERIEGFERYHLMGQVDLSPAERWYYDNKSEPFSSRGALKRLQDYYKDHLSNGYTGLRGVGDGSRIVSRRRDQRELISYERIVQREVGKLTALFLCTYNIRACSQGSIKKLVDCHHYSLIRKGLQWEAIQRNYSLGL